MVPHAGENTKLFRKVCDLGAALQALSDVGLQGSELQCGEMAYTLQRNGILIVTTAQ